MRNDPTPFVGVVGTVATIGLGEVHLLIGIVVGLATLVYVVTKTAMLYRPRDRDEDR